MGKKSKQMFVLAADTHLQVSAWSGHPELAGDSLDSFDQIVAHCIEHQAKALVLAGDLLDSNRPASMVLARMFQALNKLKEAKIDVLFIQGQHCRSNPPWLLVWNTMGGNAQWLSLDKPVQVGDAYLCGADNMSAEVLPIALKDLHKSCTHLVLHQMLKPLMGWNLEEEHIPEHVKVVLIGDYHKKYSQGRVHYPGSICMQAIDEPPQKYFFEVRGEEITPVQLKTRLVLNVTVRNEEERVEAVKQAAALKSDMRPIIVLRCGFESEATITQVREACPQAIIMDRPLPQQYEEQAEEAPGAATMEECVDSVVDSAKESELRAFLLDMIAAPDPRDVIELKIPK